MGQLDYDLHKLGWRAFQDLCAIVLQKVLGQTFHSFADTNDAGADGAFQGIWAVPSDYPLPELLPLASAGTSIVQCKFSAAGTGTLAPSKLEDEIAKAKRLRARGLCDAYVLMTNLAVTGNTAAWLSEQLRAVGVSTSLVLDGRWICQQISASPALRRYVPRVYGLGDLGKILDDRRIRQAEALLDRLEGDLATFVPTDAYRRAADAVAEHGFVLLLGEPACGKSTIAATLAMAALDNWGCGVRRVDSADELIAAWDPDEPSQLFWVDDAFGSIRHDASLTDGWSRRLDQVMTAVKNGARVVLTSRDYIYREARPFLKEYAYPRLREQAVVVDVTDLTDEEKRQILYNHLKAGDQPRTVLERWRPYLRKAAAVDRFQPEVARRLAHRVFTASVSLATGDDLLRYFERPVSFLSDVLRQLEPASRGALACVYIAGDELLAPVTFSPLVADAVARLGATEPEVLRAFPALENTFLQNSTNTDGDRVWRFRHPTIREGFAAVVAEDSNAVNVFIDGLANDELLQQIDCGGASSRGTLVRVPPTLYDRVIPRVTVPRDAFIHSWTNPFEVFLAHRCSPSFLRSWSEYHHNELPRLVSVGTYIASYWQPRVLARLHAAGALPEDIRAASVAKITDVAIGTLDGGWADPRIAGLFTTAERVLLLNRFRDEVLPSIDDEIDMSADGYESNVEPRECYEEARKAVLAYRESFEGDPVTSARLERALDYIESSISYKESEYDPRERDFDPPYASRIAAKAGSVDADLPVGRDEFDDVAEGR